MLCHDESESDVPRGKAVFAFLSRDGTFPCTRAFSIAKMRGRGSRVRMMVHVTLAVHATRHGPVRRAIRIVGFGDIRRSNSTAGSYTSRGRGKREKRGWTISGVRKETRWADCVFALSVSFSVPAPLLFSGLFMCTGYGVPS